MDSISSAEVIDKLIGGNRSEEQIRKDGARVCLRQIYEVRRCLDLLERSVSHAAITGQQQKCDGARWRAACKASDTLFQDMVD